MGLQLVSCGARVGGVGGEWLSMVYGIGIGIEIEIGECGVVDFP